MKPQRANDFLSNQIKVGSTKAINQSVTHNNKTNALTLASEFDK